MEFSLVRLVSTWPIAFAAGLTLLLLVIFHRPIAQLLTPRGIPGVPSVPGTKPIVGDIPYLAKATVRDGESLKMLEGLARQLGPIYVMRLGFFYRNVVLSDYDEVERLLLSGGRTLEKATWSRRMISPILNKAIVGLPPGDMFKHHVRIMGPSMTPKYLALSMPRAVQVALELIELFKAKSERCGGRAWDVSHDSGGAAMDAIWAVAFGESAGITSSFLEQVRAMPGELEEDANGAVVFKCKRPELAESTMQVFESVSANPLINEQLHWFVSKTPRYRRHQARVQKYLAARIASARKAAAGKGAEAAVETAGCALDMIVARELRGEDWMPEEEMKQELLEYLVGGTETSSVLLTWWMKVMANRPDLQHKLHEEMLATCPEIMERPLQYEDVTPDRTPYLEAMVWESLRVTKPTGGFMRETTEDVIILGHRVPKGTGVIIPAFVGDHDLGCNPVASPLGESNGEKGKSWQRRAGYWAAGTGMLFQPERWLDEGGKFNPNAGPSVHFGMGHRGCFGRNLAMMEMRLFMAYLSANFFFAPVPEQQNGNKAWETIARHPVHPYVRPVAWSSPEARK